MTFPDISIVYVVVKCHDLDIISICRHADKNVGAGDFKELYILEVRYSE